MTYEELNVLLTQANEENNRGNYQEAERIAQEVIDSISLLKAESISTFGYAQDRLKGEELRCTALLTMCAACGQRGNYQLALSQAEEALSVAEEQGFGELKARALGNIGLVHSNLSDYAKALEYFHKALGIAEELGSKAAVARHLGNIGIVHADLSDYAKALEYYDKALIIAEELGNKAGVARYLGNIGVVHWELSEYTKALECYDKALSIDEELGSRAGVAADLGNIGLVHAKLSDYARALEYYIKSLSMYEELGNKAGVAISLGNIGRVHFNLSDYAKALEYHGKALSIAEELGHKAAVATNLGSIGNVLEKLKDYDRALEYSGQALHLMEELGQKSEASEARGVIGGLYAIKEWDGRDESKAEAYLLESIAVSEELGTKKFDVHKTLAELYQNQERWKESHYHLGKYLTLKDEVQSEESKKSAALMEQKKQIAEREKEIAIAKATAEAQMSATTGLLYKVLPQSIAARLIKGEKVADYFRDVSILFADIVGFTPIASRMPAKSVLAFLNFVFGEFDRIMEKNGCQKIKTMGDGYMAVSGAPVVCDDHAERLARAALEIMNGIELSDEIRSSLPKGSVFHLRIGLHTGSAFAGIVGEKGFVYDVYSDAVNLAARMESQGEAGRIHCSQDFAMHLQNRDGRDGKPSVFTLEERGEMDIKGKGMMRTYFLIHISE